MVEHAQRQAEAAGRFLVRKPCASLFSGCACVGDGFGAGTHRQGGAEVMGEQCEVRRKVSLVRLQCDTHTLMHSRALQRGQLVVQCVAGQYVGELVAPGIACAVDDAFGIGLLEGNQHPILGQIVDRCAQHAQAEVRADYGRALQYAPGQRGYPAHPACDEGADAFRHVPRGRCRERGGGQPTFLCEMARYFGNEEWVAARLCLHEMADCGGRVAARRSLQQSDGVFEAEAS